MSNPPELVKIGDFAKLAETNLRTLRYYEEIGLLTPTTRSRGGFRYYRRTDVNRVHLIRDLQELGLPLERIRELVGAREAGEDADAFRTRIQTALVEQDRLLTARLHALEEQRARVALALAKLAECRLCEHAPHAGNNFCEPCVTTGKSLPPHLSALYQ